MAKKTTVAPPKIRKHLEKIQPYPPGKPIEEVQREYGLDSVIKLASNENPCGPSPKAVKAMQAAAGEMHLYPDGGGFYLKDALAGKIGVKADEILLGNGSDEIVAFLAMAYLTPRRGLITSKYSFVRYRMAAELVGAPCTLVEMDDLCHDLDAIAAAVDKNTAMICLDIPCNPTGTLVTKRQMTAFLDKVPKDVIVVLDQAYFEFAESDPKFPDGLKLRKRFPNLIVLRTVSKAYGLAGMRLGYMVSRPEIVTDINRIRPPFNTNRMIQIGTIAALEDKAHLHKTLTTNAKGMAALEKGFAKLGLKSWPSYANFILVDMGRDCREVFEALLREGVVTRPMAGYGLGTCVRFSIGMPAENRRCLAALKKVLA